MQAALLVDAVLRDFPGYTLRTLLDEDAHDLIGLRTLASPTLGESEDGE